MLIIRHSKILSWTIKNEKILRKALKSITLILMMTTMSSTCLSPLILNIAMSSSSSRKRESRSANTVTRAQAKFTLGGSGSSNPSSSSNKPLVSKSWVPLRKKTVVGTSKVSQAKQLTLSNTLDYSIIEQL